MDIFKITDHTTYDVVKNIVYSTVGSENHTADLFLPKQRNNTPVIIGIHGGAFQAGGKEMYHAWGKYLAENGIALFTINYQLATPKREAYTTSTQNVKDAINYVTAVSNQYQLEPTQLGIMGDSAGGYFGCLAAFDDEFSSAKIKFVVSAYGVLDIFEWQEYTNKTRTDYVVEKFFGCRPETNIDLYKHANPMDLIDIAAKNPMFKTKFMLVWGEDDTIVLPKNNTHKFAEKLKQNNIDYSSISVPNYGHFWFTKNDDSTLLEFQKPVGDIAPKVLQYAKKLFSAVSISDPTSNK